MKTNFNRMIVMLILFFSLAFDVSPVLPEKTLFHMLDANQLNFSIMAYDCHFTDVKHQVLCELDTGDPFTLNVTFDNIIGLAEAH